MPLAGTLLQWFHWALGLSYTVAPADARAATTVMDDPTEALHLAADDADLEGLRRALRRALSAGIPVDDDDMDYDRTPLGWLCYGASPHDEARRIACAELLLAAGANIEATDCYGDTPLIIAVYAPSKDCPRLVQYLLDAGANPNAIGDGDCGGYTPLHYASKEGFVEVANLLIKHGAAVNAKATCERAGRKTSLQVAIRNSRHRMYPILLSAGASLPTVTGDDAYLERVVAAGSWANYERLHLDKLTAMLTPMSSPPADIPTEVLRRIVAFAFHVGYY